MGLRRKCVGCSTSMTEPFDKARTTLPTPAWAQADVSGNRLTHHDTLFQRRSKPTGVKSQRRVGPIANTTDAPELNGQDIALIDFPTAVGIRLTRPLTGGQRTNSQSATYVLQPPWRRRGNRPYPRNRASSTYTVAWDKMPDVRSHAPGR